MPCTRLITSSSRNPTSASPTTKREDMMNRLLSRFHLFASTVRVPLAKHALLLSWAEVGEARAKSYVSFERQPHSKGHLLIGVVHVVLDGVNSRLARAAVTTPGATRSRGSLKGSIGDEVTAAGAGTLEGVVHYAAKESATETKSKRRVGEYLRPSQWPTSWVAV
jgi:hypothetical protein